MEAHLVAARVRPHDVTYALDRDSKLIADTGLRTMCSYASRNFVFAD